LKELRFDSPLDCWKYFCKSLGKFKNLENLLLVIKWKGLEDLVSKMEGFREGKKKRRIEKYLNKEEVRKFKKKLRNPESGVTVRFGIDKPNREPCMIAGVFLVSHNKFCIYYRTLEVTLEMIFDFWLLNYFFKEVEISPKSVEVFCVRAFSSNRKGRMDYVKKFSKRVGA